RSLSCPSSPTAGTLQRPRNSPRRRLQQSQNSSTQTWARESRFCSVPPLDCGNLPIFRLGVLGWTPVDEGKSRSTIPLLEHLFSGVKQKLAHTPAALSTHVLVD